MLPLLITGISGVAGFNAFAYFQRRYPGQVVGVRPPQTWQISGAGLKALFDKHRFGAILNCTGNCALKSCELDQAMAWRTNVASAASIAAVGRANGCRLVHLSSDLVFSGAGVGGYVETDAVDP